MTLHSHNMTSILTKVITEKCNADKILSSLPKCINYRRNLLYLKEKQLYFNGCRLKIGMESIELRMTSR